MGKIQGMDEVTDIFRTYSNYVNPPKDSPSKLMEFCENLSRHRAINPEHWLRINSSRGTVTLEATGPMSWAEKADMLRDALRVVEAEAVRPSMTYSTEVKP